MSLIRSSVLLVLTSGLWLTRGIAQQPPQDVLTPTVRAAMLDSIRTAMANMYVDADTGRMIAAVLQRQQRAGVYDTLIEPRRFAARVTADLRSLNHDKHLVLVAPRAAQDATAGAPIVIPPHAHGASAAHTGPAAATGSPDARPSVPGSDIRGAARRNFGLRKLEIMPGNIGYLEVAGFDGADGVDAVIGDALRFLERCDAIIIDVRRNGGGSGEMSHLLFSHFLPATPIQTIRVRNRMSRTDTVYTSVATVPGPRRTSVPLYVLTSRFTGSAAEEFAFVLKNAARATIIGEGTAGAGHMNHFVDVGGGFQLSVSVTRVSDPRSGAEWEQVGVTPTIAVAADSALDVAREEAVRRIASQGGARILPP